MIGNAAKYNSESYCTWSFLYVIEEPACLNKKYCGDCKYYNEHNILIRNP